MNGAQVESFVMQYLQSTKSQIIEKGRGYATCKLSPQADKELTQRIYYWGFVERTGAVPETLTYRFVFDPLVGGTDTGTDLNAAAMRIPAYETTFGSRGLERIFQAVKSRGRWVCLFEEPLSSGSQAWLGINYKIELACDMKRSELHSLGVSLTSGQIIENFHDALVRRNLTPRLPLNVVQPKQMSIGQAANLAEQHLEALIQRYDHTWAAEARERLQAEQTRMNAYYERLLQTSEAKLKAEVEQQYLNRRQEIDWQYQPRIQVAAINCGLFYLNGIP